jgi:hypothetical protein
MSWEGGGTEGGRSPTGVPPPCQPDAERGRGLAGWLRWCDTNIETLEVTSNGSKTSLPNNDAKS